MTIDWTQPIELATVPTRPAQMTAMRSWGTAEVDADWDADGTVYPLLVSSDGNTQIPGVPTVRNVRPGDLEPAEPAPIWLRNWQRRCARHWTIVVVVMRLMVRPASVFPVG